MTYKCDRFINGIFFNSNKHPAGIVNEIEFLARKLQTIVLAGRFVLFHFMGLINNPFSLPPLSSPCFLRCLSRRKSQHLRRYFMFSLSRRLLLCFSFLNSETSSESRSQHVYRLSSWCLFLKSLFCFPILFVDFFLIFVIGFRAKLCKRRVLFLSRIFQSEKINRKSD